MRANDIDDSRNDWLSVSKCESGEAISFGDQLFADAALGGSRRPPTDDAVVTGERMELSATW